MPRSALGQQVTFAIEVDEDKTYAKWTTYYNVKPGDTIAKIAAKLGHPDDARAIADENGVRSVKSKFTGRGIKKLRVPGNAALGEQFSVLPGEQAPRIVDGYARYSTIDRPERVGLTTFDGFNPLLMEVSVRFEAYMTGDGASVERDIELLERMAGRGGGVVNTDGPPPIIRVSTTGPAGEVVPLIPRGYQWSLQSKAYILWRVVGIEWDDMPLRNSVGNRVRQIATVTLQQHTPIAYAQRSVAQRAKKKTKK